MKLVSYNTQYAKGKDAVVDLDRIAAEVDGADVIALQEVDRHWTRSAMVDQAAQLAARFPDYFWSYGAGCDLDASLWDDSGQLVNRRRQFGNMLMARTPLLSCRNHLLPKLGLIDQLSIQRSALEAVIEAPSGPVRVYSVHLAHAAAPERIRQVEALLNLVAAAPREGAVLSGRDAGPEWEEASGRPMPAPAILLGDFNFKPDSPEYERLCGAVDPSYGRLSSLFGLVDCWIAAGNESLGGATTISRGVAVRIDYALVTPDLADRVQSMKVDGTAEGSDHQPIWVEIAL